jgi:hypothetical protein
LPGRPSRSSTPRARAWVAMHVSAPGILTHDKDEVRPSAARAIDGVTSERIANQIQSRTAEA